MKYSSYGGNKRLGGLLESGDDSSHSIFLIILFLKFKYYDEYFDTFWYSFYLSGSYTDLPSLWEFILLLCPVLVVVSHTCIYVCMYLSISIYIPFLVA